MAQAVWCTAWPLAMQPTPTHLAPACTHAGPAAAAALSLTAAVCPPSRYTISLHTCVASRLLIGGQHNTQPSQQHPCFVLCVFLFGQCCCVLCALQSKYAPCIRVLAWQGLQCSACWFQQQHQQWRSALASCGNSIALLNSSTILLCLASSEWLCFCLPGWVPSRL